MANPKNTVMLGRKIAKPTLRKFNGGEIVKAKAKGGLGRNKKWIVENDGHESDVWTNTRKHSYYRCRRGATVVAFRSDEIYKIGHLAAA